MGLQPTKSKSPILVKFDDSETQFLVEREDGDRAVLSAAELVDALVPDNSRVALMGHQSTALVNTLREWFHGNSQDVHSAFLASRDHGLLFLVVPKNPRYSRSLEDSLSELDVKIANDVKLSAFDVSMLVLPSGDKDALQCFIPATELQNANEE